MNEHFERIEVEKEKDIILNNNKESDLEDLSEFNNEFNINSTSLIIFPPVNNSYIKISPDNKFIAFLHNNILEIYIKENLEWKRKKRQELIYFEKSKIKGMNWSLDSKMILIYGDNSELNSNKEIKEQIEKNKALLKVIILNNLSWNCEIAFNGIINHSSFYPDSMNIVYIKSLFNILNILSLSKESNKKRNIYYYLKFDDERSINYIKNGKNIYMIIPCYGRTSLDIKNYIKLKNEPSDYIIILLDQKPFKCFQLKTKDLGKIIPFNNDYSSFFIVVEKEFYKLPFYIFNLYGETIFKSDFEGNKILTNPCLLCNKDKKINFIVVQTEGGKLEIFGCQNIFNRSEIFFFYDYNKLYENKKNKKNKKFSSENYTDNYIKKNDILFLKEKIDERKKQNLRELIKTEPFNVDICTNENDYLLHCEISPNKNFISFINKKYPKYLFFSAFYQKGVFKIIKFYKEITCFKWSTQKDILLVTLDDSIFYIITKDHYLSYNIGENYHFNNIEWSPLGKEVILSNEEKKLLIILQ